MSEQTPIPAAPVKKTKDSYIVDPAYLYKYPNAVTQVQVDTSVPFDPKLATVTVCLDGKERQVEKAATAEFPKRTLTYKGITQEQIDWMASNMPQPYIVKA